MSNPDFAKLMDDLHQVVRDVEHLLSGAVDEAKDSSGEVRDRARDTLHKVKEHVANIGDRVSDQARAASDATHQYVRNNPWQSLGFAAALGVVIGYLLRRRD